MRFLDAKAVKIILYISLPLVLIAVWVIVSAFELVNPFLIPPPEKVWETALELFASGVIWNHIAISLARVWGGFILSVLFALPLALLFHEVPFLRRAFHGLFEMLHSVPPLALIPLLILWFGIGEGSKIAVIILASFFPAFLNAESAFASMDTRLLELSRSLDLSYSRHLFSVLIPASLPQIITGLRLGFGYAWRALLGAELIASASGLGYFISNSQAMARTDRVFAGIIIIGLLGTFFDAVLRRAARTLAGYDIPGTA